MILHYEETVLRITDSFPGSKVQQSLPVIKQTHYAYLCSESLLWQSWSLRGLCSGPTHKALLSVLQRAHHGCCVPLLLLFLLQRLLPVLQLFFVQSELDGIGCRPRPQIVHAGLQSLQGNTAIRKNSRTEESTSLFKTILM